MVLRCLCSCSMRVVHLFKFRRFRSKKDSRLILILHRFVAQVTGILQVVFHLFDVTRWLIWMCTRTLNHLQGVLHRAVYPSYTCPFSMHVCRWFWVLCHVLLMSERYHVWHNAIVWQLIYGFQLLFERQCPAYKASLLLVNLNFNVVFNWSCDARL